MFFRTARPTKPPFRFAEPGQLVDGDLQLIEPEQRYIDEVLAACRHPQTLRDAPEQAKITRQSLADFLTAAPRGHHPGSPDGASDNSGKPQPPSYHFWMRLTGNAPLRIAGGIGLRIGNSADLINYVGHVGYNVYPASRGQHLAERACRLLFPLARHHGLTAIWITCNPENIASRRTCERLGATLVGTVPVPQDHDLFARGEKEKCRYRIELNQVSAE